MVTLRRNSFDVTYDEEWDGRYIVVLSVHIALRIGFSYPRMDFHLTFFSFPYQMTSSIVYNAYPSLTYIFHRRIIPLYLKPNCMIVMEDEFILDVAICSIVNVNSS